MSDLAIRVDNLSKRYRLGTYVGGGYGRLTESLWESMTLPVRKLRGKGPLPMDHESRELWALRDISLEVQSGEVVGIVGRNGAGKTTLLKVLSRITEPTSGYAELYGRVGTLLEVGTGFHPELTGRENIFLNGAILGMRGSEIRQKFDEIVDFAEVERFIDTPVKRYSSGMYVRLAFAVAASLEPEILIIDEVLAVGDAAFQKKCLGKMGEVAREGRTVLFVSHNMGAVAELCTRAILLDQGREVAEGDVASILNEYSQRSATGGADVELEPDPSLPCSFIGLSVRDGQGNPTGSFDIRDEVKIGVVYEVAQPLQGLQVTATVARNMVDIFHTFDTDHLTDIPTREPGTYRAEFTIPGMFLKAGLYSIRITAGTPDRLIQDLDGELRFEVEERSTNAQQRGYRKDRAGHVIAPTEWRTEKVG